MIQFYKFFAFKLLTKLKEKINKFNFLILQRESYRSEYDVKVNYSDHRKQHDMIKWTSHFFFSSYESRGKSHILYYNVLLGFEWLWISTLSCFNNIFFFYDLSLCDTSSFIHFLKLVKHLLSAFICFFHFLCTLWVLHSPNLLHSLSVLKISTFLTVYRVNNRTVYCWPTLVDFSHS